MALLRALTEAAQARVTFISGTRDDYPVDAWEADYRRRRLDVLGSDLLIDTADPPTASFDEVPSFTAPSLKTTSTGCSPGCRATGIDQVIAVDLSKEALGLPVVRVVVPGLEGPNDGVGGYTPGARARRLVARAP